MSDSRLLVRRLLTLLLALSVLPYWAVTARAILDDDTVHWGFDLMHARIAGVDTLGDFGFLALILLFGVSLVYLGWTRGGWTFTVGALGWFGLRLVNALDSALAGEIVLRSGFWGASLNLSWPLAAWNGVAVLLALVWAVTLVRKGVPEEQAAYTPQSRHLTLTALALVPVALVLFRLNALQNLTNLLAIVLVMGQWVVVNAAWAARGASGTSTPPTSRKRTPRADRPPTPRPAAPPQPAEAA